MPNLISADPGETLVCKGPDGYVTAIGGNDGRARTFGGKSFSAGAYDVVNRVDECDACGHDVFNRISGTKQLVCKECGQRHE